MQIIRKTNKLVGSTFNKCTVRETVDNCINSWEKEDNAYNEYSWKN
jgi:hypothetical protein